MALPKDVNHALTEGNRFGHMISGSTAQAAGDLLGTSALSAAATIAEIRGSSDAEKTAWILDVLRAARDAIDRALQ